MKVFGSKQQKDSNVGSNSNRGQQSTTIQLKDQMQKMKDQKDNKEITDKSYCCDLKLSQRLFETYTQYFHRVLYRINKPLWLAWLILLFNYIQMQLLSFTDDLKEEVKKQHYETYALDLYNILEYSHFVKIINIITENNEELSRHIVNVVSFFLNLQFLLFILVAIIFNFKKENQGNDFIKSILCFESVYLQLYGYIFFIPSIYSASSTILNENLEDNPLYYSFAALSLLFSLIIGVIFHIHDFDYRFLLENHLSRRHSNWSYIRFICETAIVGFYCRGLDSWIINLLLLLTGILNIIEFFVSLPFYSKSIQILYMSISLNKVFMSLIFLVYMTSNSMNSMLIVCVCVAPLCQVLSGRLHQMKYRHIITQLISQKKLKNKTLSAKWFDQFVRYIYYNFDYFYEDYMVNKSGVLYETVYLSHIEQCSRVYCFCHSNISDSQYDVNFLGDRKRRQFMDYYLMDLMESYLNELKTKDDNYFKLIYSYINFLIDVKQIPQKVNYELLKMKNSNIKNRSHSIDSFEKERQSNLSKKNQVSSFIGSLLYEQMKERSEDKFSLYYSKDEFQNQRLSLQLVIEFDELLNSSHSYLQDIVYQQGAFYAFLSQDYLNIEQLEKKAQLLKARRDFFRQYIQRMFDINYSNSTLLEIAMIYSQSLDFENKTIKGYIKDSKRILTRQLKKEDYGIDLFKNESCVIKISLLSQVGIVRQASSQFEPLLGYSQKEITGQKINLIIPGFFQKHFQDIVNQFINSHETVYSVLCNKILTFPVRFQGFILPMYMRINIYQSDEDFGVCAYLEKHNQNKQYIIISEQGQILEISEQIYNCAFSTDNSKLSNIKRVDLLKVLPVLGCILKSKNTEQQELVDMGSGRKTSKEIQTLMIVNSRIQKQYYDSTNSLDDYYKKTFSQFKGKGYKYILASWCLHQQEIGEGQSIKFIEVSKFRRLDASKYSNLITMQIECAKHFMNIHLNLNLTIDVASYINLFQGGLTTITNPSSTNITNVDSRFLNKTVLKTLMHFESLLTSKYSSNFNSKQQSTQGNQSTASGVNSQIQSSPMNIQHHQNHSDQCAITDDQDFIGNKQQFNKQITLIQQQAREILAGSSALIQSNQSIKFPHSEATNINVNKAQEQESVLGDLDFGQIVQSDRQMMMNRQLTNINLDESENLDDSHSYAEEDSVSPRRSKKKQTIVKQKKKVLTLTPTTEPSNYSKFKSTRYSLERESSFFHNVTQQQPIMLSPKYSEKVNLLQESGLYDGHEFSKNDIDSAGNLGIDAIESSHLNPSIMLSNQNLLSNRSQQPVILSQRSIINHNSNIPAISLEVYDENHNHINQSRNDSQNYSYHQNNISSHKTNQNNHEYNQNQNHQNTAHQSNNRRSLLSDIQDHNENLYHNDNQSLSINQNNQESNTNFQNQSSIITGYFASNGTNNNNNSNNNFNNVQTNQALNMNIPSQGSILELQAGQSTPVAVNGGYSSGSNNSSNLMFLNKKFNSTLDNITYNGITQGQVGSNLTLNSTNQINSLSSLAQLNSISNKIVKEDSRRRKSLFSSKRINTHSPQKKLTHVSFKEKKLDSSLEMQMKDKQTDRNYDPNKFNFEQFQFYNADKSQEIWEESSQSEDEDDTNYANNLKMNSLDVVNEEIEVMDYSHFMKNIEGSKKFKKSKKTNVHQQNQEQSSIHSSQTHTSTQRLYVMNVIKSRRQPKLFVTANILGYLGLLLLIAMTSGLYVETSNQFSDQHYSMVNMPLSTNLYSTYSHLIKNRNIQQLYLINYFKFTNTSYLTQQKTSLESQQVELFSSFKRNIYDIEQAKTNMKYVSYIYNTDMELGIYPSPYVYDNMIKIKQSILYSFMILQGYLYKQVFPPNQFDAILGEVFSVTNVEAYKEHLSAMEELVVEVTQDSFSSIDNIYNVSLSIIVIVSFFVVVIIYIMNITFITNREGILKLFSTFSPELLSRLINNLDENLRQLFSIRTFMTTFNNLNQNNQSNNNLGYNNDKKGSTNLGIVSGNLTKGGQDTIHSLSRLQQNGRKTISLTSQLSKFNCTTIVISCVVLAIVSTYPLINLFVKNKFKKESQTHVQELGYILSVPAHLGQSLFAHYGVMGFRLKGFKAIKDPSNIYYNITKDIASENQKKVDNLYLLLELSQSFQRSQQSNYDKSFYPILNSNACDILESSSSHSDPMMITKCRKIFSGIFEKGYIVALKKLFNLMDQLSEMYETVDSNLLQTNLVTWSETINQEGGSDASEIPGIVAFDDAYELIIYITDFLTDFVIEQYQTSYNRTSLFLILLFVYSILIFLMLFFFGWYKFFHSQLVRIYKTRNLLTIFQISTLVENPYIMSYFKQIISYKQNSSSDYRRFGNPINSLS